MVKPESGLNQNRIESDALATIPTDNEIDAYIAQIFPDVQAILQQTAISECIDEIGFTRTSECQLVTWRIDS